MSAVWSLWPRETVYFEQCKLANLNSLIFGGGELENVAEYWFTPREDVSL